MVYLYYISCLRYTILVGNPRYALARCWNIKQPTISNSWSTLLQSQESEVRELLERLEHVTKDCSDTKKLLNIKTEELAKVKMELQASENNLKQVLFEVHDSARRQAESKQRHEVVEKEKAKASKQLDEVYKCVCACMCVRACVRVCLFVCVMSTWVSVCINVCVC